MSTGKNDDWIRTIIGAVSAVAVATGGVYTVVIIPQSIRIEKLEMGREKDQDRLALLYTSIQTNDEYKKKIDVDLSWIRSDLQNLKGMVTRTEEEQKRRSSNVASVPTIIARIDRLDRRLEEQDRKSSPTIVDEIRYLREELNSLRQRIMVPATSLAK